MDRLTFMIIMIMMIFLMMPRGPDESTGEKDREVLQKFKNDLVAEKQMVAKSEYNLGYGDLPGFKLSYQDNLEHRNVLLWPFREYSDKNPWTENEQDSILPNEVSDRIREFWGTDPVQPSGKAYQLNISGEIFGEFEAVTPNHPIQPYDLQMPLYLQEYYDYYRQQKYEDEKQRYELDPENNSPPEKVVDLGPKIGNITTYDHGPIRVSISSLLDAYPDLDLDKHKLRVHDDAVAVVVEILLKNSTESDSNTFQMFGVYFQNTGSLVAVSKSAKFRGNHALPHLTMSASNFNISKTLMTRLLNVTDIQKELSMDDVNRSIEKAKFLCEVVSYFQFEKTPYTRDQLNYIDSELHQPQGLPLPRIPELEIGQALIYSPDCGLVFANKKGDTLSGERVEVTTGKLRHVLICFLVLVLMELNLIMKQTKRCHTPSQLSNVSTMCIGLLSFYDLVVMVLSVITLWRRELYLICTCIGVFSGFLYYLFEVRYLLTISATQANERGTTWWEILRGSTDTGAGSGTGEGATTENTGNAENRGTTATAAATTTTTTPATTAPANPAEESSLFAAYAFAGFMLSCVVAYLILVASEWRISVRRIGEYIGVLLMNSYWVPQFFRNTLKNRRQSLLWEFVFGTSLVRYIPVVYLSLDTSNPFRHGKNPLLVYALTSWLAFQIFMLYLQSKLGARFWVNERWLPEQYNYHSVMSLSDLEHGFASDILANMKPHSDGSNVSMCEIDCAICMSSLTIPVLAKNDPKEKKSYEHMMKECLVTPCHHIFHADCLENWMIYKLQCPVCRCSLPPV